MLKVHILTKCEFCDGEAYIQEGEAISMDGEVYTHYRPCYYCKGKGELEKWVRLDEFLEMLTTVALADPMEPDWLELAQRKSTSQYQDSRDAADI